MKVLNVDTGETTNWRFPFADDAKAMAAFDRIGRAMDSRATHAVIEVADGEWALIPIDKIKMVALFLVGVESPTFVTEKAYAVLKAVADKEIDDAIKAVGGKMGFTA